MPAATDSVRASLTAALEQLQQEHAQLTEDLARLEESESQLRDMLQSLSGVAPHTRDNGAGARDKKLQVSKERLEKVRAHLCDVGSARQADIARAIGENSGTVSVALRVLAREGAVVQAGLDRGARVWEIVSED